MYYTVRTIMLKNRGHRNEFRHQSPECPITYLLTCSILDCFNVVCPGKICSRGAKHYALWIQASQCHLASFIPQFIYNSQCIYITKRRFLHTYSECVSGSVQALLPNVTWVLSDISQMQPRCWVAEPTAE